MQPVEDSAAKSYKSKEESYEDSWDCKEESSENAKEPALIGHSAILSLNFFCSCSLGDSLLSTG